MSAGPALRSLAIAIAATAILATTAPAEGQRPRRRYVSDGDCSQIGAFVPVPVERVRSRVPNGYAIMGEEAGTAFVLVTIGACDPWRIDGRRVTPLEFGLVSVVAHPEEDPPGLAGYDLWWLVDSRPTWRRFDGIGFFAREVDVTYSVDRGPPLDVRGRVPWSRSRFRMAGTGLDAPPPNASAPSQHWYDGPYGRIRSDHENTEASVEPLLVTITAEPDSPLARILGANTTRIPGGLLEFHHHGVTRLEPSQP